MAKRTKAQEKAPAKAPAKTAAHAARPTKDKPASGAGSPLDLYGKGLERLHAGDWAKAAELFEKVLAAADDEPTIAARARQYLAASRQRIDGAGPRPAKADDPFLEAVFEKNRGDLDAALALCRKGGRDGKDERFAYLAASIYAVQDRTDEAVEALARAVELNPKNRIHAFHDADFAELRKSKDHAHLFGLA